MERGGSLDLTVPGRRRAYPPVIQKMLAGHNSSDIRSVDDYDCNDGDGVSDDGDHNGP